MADQELTLAEGDSLTMSLTGLLAGANRLVVLISPANGTLAGDPGALTYTPNPDFNGTDVATIVIGSDSRESVPFDITYRVSAVDDPPRNSGQPATFFVEGFESVSVGPTIVNPDGLPLTTTAVNLPPWATVDSAAGRVTGVPTNAELGIYPGISLTVSNAAGAFTTGPFSIEVGFGANIRFDVYLSTAGFIQSGQALRMAVDGNSVLLVGEGADNTGTPRLALQLFDPEAGAVLWERLLPGARRPFGPVKTFADGFIIASTDSAFNGVITGIDRDGNLLWEFEPTPLSATNTALPRDVDALADGRILATLHQGNPRQGDPFLHRLAFYDPGTDTLAEVDFDSGVADAPRAWRVAGEPDGSYWLSGGNIITGTDVPTDAWVRRYAADGTVMFSTLIPARGMLRHVSRHPGGDLLIGGSTPNAGAWLGRVESSGGIRFLRDLQSGSVASDQVRDIAVQPNGVYSVLMDSAEYVRFSESDVELERRQLERGTTVSSIVAHPLYYVLHQVAGRIESVPR